MELYQSLPGDAHEGRGAGTLVLLRHDSLDTFADDDFNFSREAGGVDPGREDFHELVELERRDLDHIGALNSLLADQDEQQLGVLQTGVLDELSNGRIPACDSVQGASVLIRAL